METQLAQALQNRLYFVLEQLQSMAKELPVKYQQRINHELLSGLANTLLHDTIFEIVKGLKDIQDVTEKHLFQSRLKFLEQQRLERHSLKEKKGTSPEYTSELKRIQTKQRMEQKQNDMKIIMQIDQKVSDQQVMMEKAGVPGFHVTNDPSEIRLQMYLFEFIFRLSEMPLPPAMQEEEG
ncbi:Gonadal protein gdl [Orchesella cincta]|uniref:Gonadal protein gdl n=1 Tax=Orchesella cincta TaxID=48709 RepID=A0A1D2M7T3_ORCCI|nr:Gonadal protein gdl [Orchesella cincta]